MTLRRIGRRKPPPQWEILADGTKVHSASYSRGFATGQEDQREAFAQLCESEQLMPALHCPPWDDARKACAKAIRGEWPFEKDRARGKP